MERVILDRMSVPGAHGLFVLGCFERRVTLYSQQVRALNLIFALRETLLATRPAIAVIGAGASGLTAAAAAAACGCRVVVFERLGRPLGFIGPARTRWLHPHIYDWPAADAENPDAGLPLLTWREGLADRVGDALQTQWNELTRRFPVPVDLHCDVTNLTIDESAAPAPGSRRRHVLTWNGHGPEPVSSSTAARRMWMDEFDLVVLAVGFGVERPTRRFPHVKSYWQADRIDEEDRYSKRPDRRVLISGTGDGGLVDLLRYSFAQFRHDEILKRLRDHLAAQGQLDRVLDTIHEIEAQATSRGAAGEPYAPALNLAYRRLADSLPSRAVLPIRRNIHATLTGRGTSPFDLESAALNRFLASFTDMEFIAKGTRKIERPREDGPYHVTFANGETQEFDEVLVRHGPASALKQSFPEVWDRCRDLESHARTTPDPTRLPVYGRFYDDLLGVPQIQIHEIESAAALVEPPQLPAPPESSEPPRSEAEPVRAAAAALASVAAHAEPAERDSEQLQQLSGLIGVPVEHFSDIEFYELLLKAPDSIDRRLLRLGTGWAVHHLPLRGGILKRLAKELVSLVCDEEPGGRDLFATVAESLAGADPSRLRPFVDRLAEIAVPDQHDVRARVRGIIALGLLKSPEAVDSLIDRLRHDYRPMRELAATALGTIGESSAVTPLVDAYLHDEGTLVLDEALKALVSIGGEQVVTHLLTILGDPALSVNLRWPVAAALERFGSDRRVVPVLVAALGADEALVREHAARSLGKLGDPTIAPALRPLLDDARFRVRQAAAHALGDLGNGESSRDLLRALDDGASAVRAEAWYTLMRLDPGALRAAALARVTDTSAWRRDEAVRWLCELGGVEWAEAHRATLGVSAKEGFVRGLWTLRDERAARLLLSYVDDPSWKIRRDATYALGTARYRPALPALVTRMLTDSSEEVRTTAIMALGEIGDPAAIDALCDALRTREPMRTLAAIALGSIGDARAIPALVDACHRASRTRESALSAIGQIAGAPAVEALSWLYILQTPHRRGVIMNLLGSIDHPDVVALALRGTIDEKADVRICAYEALRVLPWSTMKAGLAQALRHADAGVRRQAIEMVAIYADDEMRAQVVLAVQDADATVRAAAAEAREQLEAVDALRAFRPSSTSMAS